MVLHFQKKLSEVLEHIQHQGEGKEFLIHEKSEQRHLGNTDEILQKYANAKWQIIEMLNQKYRLCSSLKNWILENKKDEVAYFLNEAGANALYHGKYKAPAKLMLWFGKKGFVVGIEQQGEGFDAEKAEKKYAANEKKYNERSGGNGFAFFKSCKSAVFFDDTREARTVFLQFIFLNNFFK